MTISSEVVAIIYAGNASTVTPYTIPFSFFDEGDIWISLKDTLTETVFQPVISQDDFTVTKLADDSGGSLVTDTAYPSTTEVMIFREMDILQPTDFPPEGPFPAAAHERALDRQTMIMQQLWAQLLKLLGLTSGNVILAPGGGITLNGQVQVFADASARGAATPLQIGQLGIQLDTNALYRGSAVTVGSWTAINNVAVVAGTQGGGLRTISVDGDVVTVPYVSGNDNYATNALYSTWDNAGAAAGIEFALSTESQVTVLGFSLGTTKVPLDSLVRVVTFTGSDRFNATELKSDGVLNCWTHIVDANDVLIALVDPTKLLVYYYCCPDIPIVVAGGAFSDTDHPTDTEVRTWVRTNYPNRRNQIFFFNRTNGDGDAINPDYTWGSDGGGAGSAEVIRIRDLRSDYHYNTLLVRTGGNDTSAAISYKSVSGTKAWDHNYPFATVEAAYTAADAGAVIIVQNSVINIASQIDPTGKTLILDNSKLTASSGVTPFLSTSFPGASETGFVGIGCSSITSTLARVVDLRGGDNTDILDIKNITLAGSASEANSTKATLFVQDMKTNIDKLTVKDGAAIILNLLGAMEVSSQHATYEHGLKTGIALAATTAVTDLDLISRGDRFEAYLTDNNGYDTLKSGAIIIQLATTPHANHSFDIELESAVATARSGTNMSIVSNKADNSTVAAGIYKLFLRNFSGYETHATLASGMPLDHIVEVTGSCETRRVQSTGTIAALALGIGSWTNNTSKSK